MNIPSPQQVGFVPTEAAVGYIKAFVEQLNNKETLPGTIESDLSGRYYRLSISAPYADVTRADIDSVWTSFQQAGWRVRGCRCEEYIDRLVLDLFTEATP